tara:strand:- start:972 stop:1088 length:117 start_codon:yes stop_codon:yes gene_type:complete
MRLNSFKNLLSEKLKPEVACIGSIIIAAKSFLFLLNFF